MLKTRNRNHEPVTNALNELGVTPEDAIFIGDTVYDVMAGKAAGCHTVFLLNDFNKEVLEKEKPDRVIRNVSELLENGEN